MSHRPYPNAARARRQIARHGDEVGPVTEAGLRAATPFGQQLIDGTSAAVQALSSSLAASFAKMLPVDEYRLSTR